VELAGGLATELDFAVAFANFPAEEGPKTGHGGQNDAPVGVGVKWLGGRVGGNMSESYQ
jgi:hypothetical protein